MNDPTTPGTPPSVEGIVTRPSLFSVEETLERLQEAIHSRNLNIFAQIDHSSVLPLDTMKGLYEYGTLRDDEPEKEESRFSVSVNTKEVEDMKLREAQLSDAAAMARVIVDSYRSAHRDHIPEESLMRFTYEESERNWARALNELSRSSESKEHIYVAEDDAGGLIGVAMGGPESSQIIPSIQERSMSSTCSRSTIARALDAD